MKCNPKYSIISMELGSLITICLLRYHHYILVWFGMLHLGWLQFKLKYVLPSKFFLFPSIRKKTSIIITLSLYCATSFYNCINPFGHDPVTLWTSSTVNMVACLFFYQRKEPELFYSPTTLGFSPPIIVLHCFYQNEACVFLVYEIHEVKHQTRLYISQWWA